MRGKVEGPVHRFPARVGIDDGCDGCGASNVPGVAWGAARPVLCKSCIAIAQRLLATVHYLHHGRAPCGGPSASVKLMPASVPLILKISGVPAEWPEGHLWSDDWAEVNCPGCLSRRGDFDIINEGDL